MLSATSTTSPAIYSRPGMAYEAVSQPDFAHAGPMISQAVRGHWLAIVVLATLLVSMILLWFNVLTPEYLRATVG